MLKSLQIGRGLAALAVTLFHTSLLFADPRFGYAPPFAAWTAHGDLGVDFFFVLSGFIMMLAHRKDIGQAGRLRDFAFKRFVRIYPMYWLFTLLVIAGAAFSGGVSALPSQPGDIASITSLVHFTGIQTPVAVAWTLFHEILFYGFFGMLIAHRKLGTAAMALWFGAIALQFHYTPFGQWSFFGSLFSAHNLSFLLGIAACFLVQKLSGPAVWLHLLGGFALLCAVLLIEDAMGYSDFLKLGYSIAFAYIISGCVALEQEGRLRGNAFLLLLGDASYTLYLCHENVGATALKIAARVGLTSHIDHRILYAFIVVAVTFFALAVYRYIERPMLTWLRQRYLARQGANLPR